MILLPSCLCSATILAARTGVRGRGRTSPGRAISKNVPINPFRVVYAVRPRYSGYLPITRMKSAPRPSFRAPMRQPRRSLTWFPLVFTKIMYELKFYHLLRCVIGRVHVAPF
eukprot:Rmarinus@m.9131